MTFEVELEQFSGPLQLLLELIYQEKLPITEVSLAQVTDAYLHHIDEHEVAPEELADFLVIATRLLHLKSKTLLPLLQTEEEEEEGPSLVDQLRLYEQFVSAASHIDKLFESHQMMFTKTRISIKQPEGFFPPKNVEASSLKGAYEVLLRRLEPFARLRRASIEKIVTIKERISQIRDVILQKSRMSFTDVVDGASKTDVVVSFLALLELMRERTVNVVQKKAFEDIVIKHVE